jgi:hypothetical protein
VTVAASRGSQTKPRTMPDKPKKTAQELQTMIMQETVNARIYATSLRTRRLHQRSN